MKSVYAGVFVIDLQDMTVLAVTDKKYRDDMKAPGGMMKPEDKSIRAAACREAQEEGQTQVLESTLVLVEDAGNHKRYFFLADKISTTLNKGATWEVQEKDANGKVVEEIYGRWVPIGRFIERLFFKQHPAFGAVLAELSKRKPELLGSEKFRNLLQRFPAPRNSGLPAYVD
jgi:hypothetical protein